MFRPAHSASATSNLLYRALRPRSIAIVGASETRGTLISQVFDNLRKDFSGDIEVVNPTKETVFGRKTFPSVTALPPTDLIVVIVAAARVPDVIVECAQAGHGGAYILSAGFVEAGPEGAALQHKIAETARAHSFPVFGPNCVGYLNRFEGVMANFSLMPEDPRPNPGPVGLISQSGGLGSFLLSRFMEQGLGVGLFATTGNECDMTLSDILYFFLEQPEIKMVGVFAETIRQPEIFIEAAKRALELDKPIVALRPPKSAAAARASLAHTGSTVIAPDVFDAICDQYGVLRVASIDDFVDLTILLQDGRRMGGPRVGVLTMSGGAGLLIAGKAEEQGLQVNLLGEATERKIAALCPTFAATVNPVDTTPALFPRAAFGDVLDILLEDEAIDAAIVYNWGAKGELADLILASHAKQNKPVTVVATQRPEEMTARGVPSYPDPERAARAIVALHRFSSRGPRAVAAPFVIHAERAARLGSVLWAGATGALASHDAAKRVLSEYGIDLATDADSGDISDIELFIRRDPVFGPMIGLRSEAGGASIAPILLHAPFSAACALPAIERLGVAGQSAEQIALAASSLGAFAIEQPAVASARFDRLLLSQRGLRAIGPVIERSQIDLSHAA